MAARAAPISATWRATPGSPKSASWNCMRRRLNLHPAYSSVLVDFDPRLRSHPQVEALVRERLASHADQAPPEPRRVEIPVCYGGESGPDLAAIARHTGLTEERVVELHAAAE